MPLGHARVFRPIFIFPKTTLFRVCRPYSVVPKTIPLLPCATCPLCEFLAKPNETGDRIILAFRGTPEVVLVHRKRAYVMTPKYGLTGLKEIVHYYPTEKIFGLPSTSSGHLLLH